MTTPPVKRPWVSMAISVISARRIGEEKLDAKTTTRHKSRRWVVERTLGWLSKCRGGLVRYEKKAQNHPALIQFTYVLPWYRRPAY